MFILFSFYLILLSTYILVYMIFSIFVLWKESNALPGIQTRDLQPWGQVQYHYVNQQPQGTAFPERPLNKTNAVEVLELGVNTMQLNFLHNNS